LLKKSFVKSTADVWFSIYIRLRDAQYGGHVQCCTCGGVDFWKNMTCGHFQKRGKPIYSWLQDLFSLKL